MTSVLFVLHWITKQLPVVDGTVIIYCDNDAALNEIFHIGIPSNNPYDFVTADIDLITTARDLLLQLPVDVQIKHQWVKGHFKGKHELKHELNHQADDLAGEFNQEDRPATMAPNILPPLYEAELVQDGQLVTSRLAKVIRSAMHGNNLKLHII